VCYAITRVQILPPKITELRGKDLPAKDTARINKIEISPVKPTKTFRHSREKLRLNDKFAVSVFTTIEQQQDI